MWKQDEVREVLGDKAELFMSFYDVSERGNWEGKNILNIRRRAEDLANDFRLGMDEFQQIIAASRKLLYAVRNQREKPGLDNKVLTSWNGLMLAAFAEAGRDLKRDDYKKTAVDSASFLFNNMRREDGRLLRTWKAGSQAKYNAFLEDYAYLAEGLLALYQTTFDDRWFSWANELVEAILRHFRDREDGGFFDTSDDHEALIHRPKDLQDNAVPSGNAMAASVLLQMSLYTGNQSYWDEAVGAVTGLAEAMARYPTGFAQWLCAADFILGDPREVAISGKVGSADAQPLIDVVFAEYRPHLVTAVGEDGQNIPLLSERPRIDGMATAYVCRRFACLAPVNNADGLAEQLRQLNEAV